MARREVLVQLDDDLVEALDAIVREKGTSRSALLRRLIAAYIEAEDERIADAQLVAAYRAQPQDPANTEAYLRLAAENAVEW